MFGSIQHAPPIYRWQFSELPGSSSQSEASGYILGDAGRAADGGGRGWTGMFGFHSLCYVTLLVLRVWYM